jgi:hypothetical protein
MVFCGLWDTETSHPVGIATLGYRRAATNNALQAASASHSSWEMVEFRDDRPVKCSVQGFR